MNNNYTQQQGSINTMSDGLNYLSQGNTHDAGGITIPGTNNEVETKESIAKTSNGNYVFSNRLKPKGSKLSFAALSKKIDKRYPRAKFDSLEKQDRQDEINELMVQQESYKKSNAIGEYANTQEVFDLGGMMGKENAGVPNPNTPSDVDNVMKKVPVYGQFYAAGKMADKTLWNRGEHGEFKNNTQAALSYGITDPAQNMGVIKQQLKEGNVGKAFVAGIAPWQAGIMAQKQALKEKDSARRMELMEATKQVSNVEPTFFSDGGKMKYDGISGTSKLDTSNNSQLPSNFQSVGHAQRFFNANPDAFSDDLIVGGKGYGEGNIKNFGQKSLDNYNKVYGSKNQTIPIQGNTIESDIDMDLANVSSTELTKLDPLNKQDFNNPNAKYGAIGLGAGLLGNAYLYGTAKKQNINYDRVNPEQINLEAERQQARRTSSDTMNILASRLNSMGRGSSNSMIAGQTAVQRNLGDQLSNSYLSEQKYNTQARNRAGELNANIQMQEVEARAREEAAYNAQRRAAIQGALTSISQYGMGLASGERDINALKAFGTANYGASQGEDGINLGYTK